MRALLEPYLKDIRYTIQFAEALGVTRPVRIDPLLLGHRNSYFANGVCFMAIRKNKRSDVLAAGGRYDHVVKRYTTPTANPEPRAAFALQIYLEKITATLAPYQNQFLLSQTALKEFKSFGYWCPRRCDVYVVSYQPGYLAERLEIAALLWKHNISADVMYEAAFRGGEVEDYLELCSTEGILYVFLVPIRFGNGG